MDTRIIHAALTLLKQSQEHGFTPKTKTWNFHARGAYLRGWKYNLLHSIVWVFRAALYAGILYFLISILT
jgi:hypothetical protein